MKIRRLLINNLKGIKNLDWILPSQNIVCLIGKGDSSKSTILDAIKYVFYPQWYLSLNDSDFYCGDTTNPIIIEVTVGALIDELCSLAKYGKYLRGWSEQENKLYDEADDHLESVLTIRLIITSDLEPKWRVVCDRDLDGVEFKLADRVKFDASEIGIYSDRQLSWAKGSSLARLTESDNLNQSLLAASRAARKSLDASRASSLKSFDKVAGNTQIVAKNLGVPVREQYRAHLDHNSIDVKIGGLALHDGDVPLRQLGMGSRRMLLCGIQKSELMEGHITLFDEVEIGLEPHRISRLIKHISDDLGGQYFLTTHSPVVLRELAIKNLCIVHNTLGIVKINTALTNHEIQGKIRSSAEAFLSKKIIVCEGATEVGFLRGLDDSKIKINGNSFAYNGVALLDVGGGSKVKAMAKAFKSLGYSVSVLADADAQKQFSKEDEKELTKFDINVYVWKAECCLEQRAMLDLPWKYVIASVKLARDQLECKVIENIATALNGPCEEDIEGWIESDKLRISIGKAAKTSNWFKSISNGDLWFKTIEQAFVDEDFINTDLAVKLNSLWAWSEDA